MESVRTCSVCRKKAGKEELFRFVRALDGEICFDEKATLPNRGAWVCAKRACLVKAFQKRILFRGERTLPVSGEEMLKVIESRMRKSILARLGLSKKIGILFMGTDAVLRVIREEKAYAVVFASDFSLRSINGIEKAIEIGEMPQIVSSGFLMEEIGLSLGRKKTGVVALLKSRITEEILLQINKLSEISSRPQEA